MSSRPGVSLAVTVHQPTERLAPLVAATLPALVSRYAAATAFCSRITHPTILTFLRQHGISVLVDADPPSGIEGIGAIRRRTIQHGLSAGTPHLQMCDFDRAIHWQAQYPAELGAVIGEIPNHDFLVLGRTDRAWATHPPYQAETEPYFNKVFALVTGLPWDVGAGSRGLSRRAAEALVESSQEMTVGIDAEWPLLMLKKEGFRVGFRPCEGLEFETADGFACEIEAAGGYKAWESRMCASPQQWTFRLKVAWLIAEAVLRYGAEGVP
jgi:hypothetical protein